MAERKTKGEPTDLRTQTRRWLTSVLCFDDLLAPSPQRLRLVDEVPEVSFRRAPEGESATFESPSVALLPGDWVSGRHAAIRIVGETRVISDEGSRNGTYVNGEKITRATLRDGDLIEIGHSLLCYREVTERVPGADPSRLGPVHLGPTQSICPEVIAIANNLKKVAPSNVSVLILGETGSGKEIAARAVHDLSGRLPYRTVNCGAVPESLFESTFFGHRRGSFTGAQEDRIGEIVQADRGTLFLDEVANMSATSQAKLLRVLEDGKVMPVGAARHQAVDVRWVAATNADLFAIDAPFRADLLKRLAGHVCRLPPLRRRREDLGALTAHFLREAGVERAAMTASAGRLLFNARFPGNIRELRDALRSAALLAAGDPIEVHHLPETLRTDEPERGSEPERRVSIVPPSIRKKRPKPNAKAIEDALTETGGNVVHAATLLETHPRQLYRLMERLGIDKDRFRG